MDRAVLVLCNFIFHGNDLVDREFGSRLWRNRFANGFEDGIHYSKRISKAMAPSVVKEFVERSDLGITQQHASNHLVTPSGTPLKKPPEGGRVKAVSVPYFFFSGLEISFFTPIYYSATDAVQNGQ